MISDINDLVRRVTLLESLSNTTPKLPVIHQITPQIVRTGNEFLVIGENLTPSLLSRIEVEETNIAIEDIKSGSSPTQLILDAPAVMGLPPNGATVILSVSNAAGTGQGSYFQLPGIAADIQATATFAHVSTSPEGELEDGQDYVLTFDIVMHSSHNETFELGAQIDPPVTGWSAEVTGSNEIEATVASAAAGLTVQRTVTVTTGPAGPANLVLTLDGTTFTSWHRSSQAFPLDLEEEPEPTDTAIVVADVTVAEGFRVFENNVLSVLATPPGPNINQGLLIVQMVFDEGTYVVGGLNSTAGWTLARVSLETMPIGSDGGSFNVVMRVTPTSSGGVFNAPDGSMSFTVTSQDGQHQLVFAAQLRIVQSLPS
jgi:hypothetical protein